MYLLTVSYRRGDLVVFFSKRSHPTAGGLGSSGQASVDHRLSDLIVGSGPVFGEPVQYGSVVVG